MLTLHEVVYELINECIKDKTRRQNSCLEEIEDDVLSKLFTEPLNISTSAIPSVENLVDDIDIETFDDSIIETGENVTNEGGYGYYDDYYEGEADLLAAEACSMRYCDEFFSTDNVHNDIMDPHHDDSALIDVFYNGEDEDGYYNFFVDNNLHRFPELFDDVVESLMDHLDADGCDEVRGDIVKLLCEKVKTQRMQGRN